MVYLMKRARFDVFLSLLSASSFVNTMCSNTQAFLVAMAVCMLTNVFALEEADPFAVKCQSWSDFNVVDFVQGTYTQGRQRTRNLPRLNCRGNCPADAVLHAAHCTVAGVGEDGRPSWKCQGNFAPSRRKYSLGDVRVECEGCTKPGDATVIQGSCALYYSVADGGSRGRRHNSYNDDSSLVSFVFFILFCMLVIYIARRLFCTPDYVMGTAAGTYPGAGAYVVHPTPYYYGGSGGFGTGMLTGLLMGEAIGSAHHHHNYNDTYDTSDNHGGGWSGGDGGFGGSDSV